MREPLPVRADRRARAGGRGRGDREHRHRRADDDPRRRQELRLRRRGRRSRRLHPAAGGAALGDGDDGGPRAGRAAADALAGRRANGLRRRRSPARPATTRRSRRGSRCAPTRASRPAGATPTRRSATCATARTPTRARPSTRASGSPTHLLEGVEQLHGKELSFNNLLDLSAARELVEDFDAPACAIVKHNNPCGCALADSGQAAYERAFACDPQSAYGGVIVVNRAVDGAFAQALSEQFIEVLLAPGFDDAARELLMAEKERAPAGALAVAAAQPRGRSQAGDRRPARADPRRRLRDARADARDEPPTPRTSSAGRTCCSPGRSAATCAQTRS